MFGSLPDSWEETSLGDVCRRGGGKIQTGPFGSQLHASDYVPDGIPTVMPANIGDNRVIEDGIARVRESDAQRLARHRLQLGDIVYSRRGDVERRALVRHHEVGWLCGTGSLLVRVGDDFADPVYISHWLGHPQVRAWISQHAVGATMANLNTEILSSVPVVVPPIGEQRAIAGMLGALDDKIESNRRILETAKRVLAAEYQSVVGSSGAEPYGLRLEVQMGAPFKGGHFSEPEQGRPLIRIRDLKTFSSQVWTTESRPDETVISPGDILVGMDAEFRSTIWLGDSGVLNQRMCRFLGRKGVSRCFVWLAIQPELEYCERAKSGTTVIHLNKGDIDIFQVPSLSDEQHEYLSRVTEPIFERLVVAGREIATLSNLRDALLPELLSGRLVARDIENFIEGVA